MDVKNVMDVEMLLRRTIPMLESMHILGAETGIMEAVKCNIRTAIKAIDKAKEEAEHADHADHDNQRKDV